MESSAPLAPSPSSPAPTAPLQRRPVPRVHDVVGVAVANIGSYKSLDKSAQVVALVDEVRFISAQEQATVVVSNAVSIPLFLLGYMHQLWKMLHGMQ